MSIKSETNKFLKIQLLGFQAELILRQKQGYQGLAITILQNKINKIEALLK